MNKLSTFKLHLTQNFTYYLIATIPVVFLIVLLLQKLVNVPFWDSWEFVTILQKSDSNTLGFADFFAQHNEHRILFPRLAMYVLGLSSGWDLRVESWFSVLLAMATFAMILALTLKSIGNKWIRLFTIGLLSTIFFSPIQWENWMWGWQIQWFMNVLAVVGALYILSTEFLKPKYRVLLAALFGAVATYSLASGFFVWLVALPLLIQNKKLRAFLPVWIAFAALVVGSHYIGYVDPSYHPSKTIFLEKPLEFIAYFLTYIGRPITHDFMFSVEIGLVYLMSAALGLGYLYAKHRKVLLKLLPWICLGVYGLLAAASTAVSRLGFGVQQAYSNRYITLSNLFLMAVVIMFIKIIELNTRKSKRLDVVTKISRSFSVIVVGMVCVMVGINVYRGVQQTDDQHKHLEKLKMCAQTAQSSQDPCILGLYPNADVVWPRVEYLRKTSRSGL